MKRLFWFLIPTITIFSQTQEAIVKLHDSENPMTLGRFSKDEQSSSGHVDGGLLNRADEGKGRFSASKSFAIGAQALNELVYEIRDPKTRPARFRQALETIGEYLSLQVLEELNTKEATLRTLMGVDAKHRLVEETPALVTILRAGLSLNWGVQKIFPNSEVGFLAMSRDEKTLKAKLEYVALPDLKGKSVILSDTMLATGGSILDAIEIIEKYEPKRIFVISAIASNPGIAHIHEKYPDVLIFAATIDPWLNEQGFILPGLGDAGDRSFGMKKFLESVENEICQNK
ncbi:MAG: uracil phosphoribosyltransferase [Chlamydiae bacterium]|nr:uracil phosphoribosyltransferase [Chlamydiota bacterium]